ncbi:MAG: cupin-like domain-containing protein [Sulfuricaulis sp.]|uniref:JmjC domain-containing protein n=1 Tax=Sulfuricaulis sp. TaxID=2003553 RepID=UPI0025CDEF17|nr:cupin domain-containing protein [Sulfuricaulis sp.]MCR4347877.1 cupin-like domain-containing protein [Sulfuricaulis sp.]
MSVANKPLLAALLSPKAADEFLNQYWPKRPFVAQSDPARWPALLRGEELASVQNLAKRYRGSLRFTHGRKSDQMIQIDRVDPSILFEMGLTLNFEDIGPYVPGTPEFLRGLESELGLNEGSLVMSAFASPFQDGLSCHFDAQDVISLQLHGTKRFHYAPVQELAMPYGTQYISGGKPYDELYAQAQNGFPENKNVKFETAAMKPGSVLFLPRGTWHYTEASEPSLSLSITISPPTLLDCAMEQIRWLLLQDSAWREPLYGATGNGTLNTKLHTHAKQLLARLPQLVASLSPEDLIQAPIPVAKRLDQINENSRFQRIPDAALELEVESDKSPQGTKVVAIRLGHSDSTDRISARLEISSEVLMVFRWIEEQRKPFTAAEVQKAFPQISFEELKKILITLTRAQFIKMFWFAELAPQARVGAVSRET